MNTSANKLYHLINLISLDMLNLGFVHFKKLLKIQFLKNVSTECCAVLLHTEAARHCPKITWIVSVKLVGAGMSMYLHMYQLYCV